MSELRVPLDKLQAAVATRLGEAGLRPDDAAVAAEVLCWADLVGRASHGVANLQRIYLDGLASGAIEPRGRARLVVDHGGVAVLDGQRSLGLVTGTHAVDLAVDRARDHGVGLVGVRNSTHFGGAGYYAERGARDGMVTLVATNCGRQRVAPPPGSDQPMLGTNPIAVAAPAGELPPFVLDMSTTVVATSRIRQAAQRGEQVPAGWLVDAEGRPTTDPELFDRGEAHVLFLGSTPEAGAFKGYGLAVAVEVLCGLLTGAAVGPSPAGNGNGDADDDGGGGHADKDIGHLFVAIDPGALGADQFESRASRMLSALLGCTTVAGDPVAYPGYLEGRRAEAGRDRGIVLDQALQEVLAL